MREEEVGAEDDDGVGETRVSEGKERVYCVREVNSESLH